MDPTLLVVGFARVALWLVALFVAYQRRDTLAVVAFSVVALNSSVFAVSNAHGHVPSTLFDVAVLLATPVAALIVSVYLRR